MKKLTIANFKAYPPTEEGKEFTLDVEKNVLLYGENGVGKSSIYQAIKMFFFKEKMIARIKSVSAPEKENKEKISTYLGKYRYRGSDPSSDFSIKVSDADKKPIDRSKYSVFMVAGTQIQAQSVTLSWSLPEMIKKAFFPIDDVEAFCKDYFSEIQEKVNEELRKFMEKSLTYRVERTKNYCIGLKDETQGIDWKEQDIPTYFNEAKVNIVLILTYLTVVKVYVDRISSDKEKVLILDDFVTSLDTANRVFIIQYLLITFRDFKMIILTHNINFYNIFKHMINDAYKSKEEWFFFNLYLSGNVHAIYPNSSVKNVDEIRDEYNKKKSNSKDVIKRHKTATEIRKCFEVLIHKFAKLVIVDYAEDNNRLLNRILSGKSVYINKKKYASDLVDELVDLLKEDIGDVGILKKRINGYIERYKWTGYKELKEVLEEMKILKKVLWNPAAHGVTSESISNSDKLINKSFFLLQKLETSIKELEGKSVIGDE